MPEVVATYQLDRKLIGAWIDGHRRQIPFAQKQAINDMAKHLKNRSLPGGAKAAFDKPRPFTSSSATWRIKYATKANVEALVFPEAKREPYLRANITGGERGVKRFELKFRGVGTGSGPGQQFFPTDFQKRDRYGNVRRSTLSKIIADAENGTTGRLSYFIGKPKNNAKPYGVYRRMARKIRPVFLPASQPQTYKRIYDIGGIADKVIKRQYQDLFTKYLDRAIKTAK